MAMIRLFKLVAFRSYEHFYMGNDKGLIELDDSLYTMASEYLKTQGITLDEQRCTFGDVFGIELYNENMEEHFRQWSKDHNIWFMLKLA